jgi:hypothetical protein
MYEEESFSERRTEEEEEEEENELEFVMLEDKAGGGNELKQTCYVSCLLLHQNVNIYILNCFVMVP